MTDQRDLELLLQSRIPLLVIETHEETRAHAMLKAAALRRYQPVFSWSITEGLYRVDLDFPPEHRHTEPVQVLRHIKSGGTSAGVYILNDFHPYLDEPLHVRLLKDIALASERNNQTVALVSHAVQVPDELQRYAATVSLALPDITRIRQVVGEVAAEWKRSSAKPVRGDEKAVEMLVQNLAGLTERDVRQLARNAIFDDGAITENDLPQVMKAKYSILSRQGTLTFDYDSARFGDVAGMARLKEWLELRRSSIVAHDPAAPLDPPKGVLLLGVQGGGKSLAAKAVAGTWHLPLLRLDAGSLYNKFHGETERNLRDSLATADAMAPCVLWIDEVEKGLAGGDNDGGTSRRVLGTLLTWMAERKSRVFLVATANEIEMLPPELVRKGRFDEIFFVDLPEEPVRKAIFSIHLKKRGQDLARLQLHQLAQASEGFSGAEIEQVIVSGLYSARSRQGIANTEDFLREIALTRPLSVTMRERIEDLRAWASERTVSAD